MEFKKIFLNKVNAPGNFFCKGMLTSLERKKWRCIFCFWLKTFGLGLSVSSKSGSAALPS